MLTQGVNHLLRVVPMHPNAVRFLMIELQEEAEHSEMFEWFCSLPGGGDERISTIPADEIRRISEVALTEPAAFLLYVLFGELYFDRVQRAALEATESPQVVRTIDALHRQDEARHISFARLLLVDLLREASSKTIRLLTYQAPLLARWTADRVLVMPPELGRQMGLDDDATKSCAAAVRRSWLNRDCAIAARQVCRRIGLDDPRMAATWDSTIKGTYGEL